MPDVGFNFLFFGSICIHKPTEECNLCRNNIHFFGERRKRDIKPQSGWKGQRAKKNMSQNMGSKDNMKPWNITKDRKNLYFEGSHERLSDNDNK